MKKLLFLILLFGYLASIGQHSGKEGFKKVNGVELYYKSMGEGEPIMVVHGGAGLDEGYFHPGIDPLSRKYRVITYDQRGSGRSKGTLDTARLSVDQYVEDIEGLRKSLGLKKIHLMGHSFGGLLSLLYATKYPENLQSLILVGAGGAKDSTTMPKTAKTVEERTTQADKDTVAKMTAAGYFNTWGGRSKLFPILWKPYVYDKEKIRLISTSINDSFLFIHKHVGKTFKTSVLFDKLNERLHLVNMPTLILHGDFDPLPLSTAELTHQLLKNSKLVILKNCGHFPFIEQQEMFIKVVNDFLHSTDR
ncbi:MAG TPA: alpha/beta fold hydrolase [Chitinophagaceae bacterium]|jgi:proline iminopeptidase|nr:alpha/beta fold hydrolase [Chitinophagaceae bacterium]